MTRALPFVVVALVPALAHADPNPQQVIVVGRASPSSPWTDAPTEAHVGDGAELAVVIVARDHDHRVVLADDEIAPLVLSGHTVAARDRRAWPDGAAVRWSTVEPYAWHQPGREAHQRQHRGLPLRTSRPRRATSAAGSATTSSATSRRSSPTSTPRPPRAAAPPRSPARYRRRRREGRRHDLRRRDRPVLGQRGARRRLAPTTSNESGIEHDVHRVSLRLGDDFLGFLSAYFLVPEVFGSAGGGRDQPDRSLRRRRLRGRDGRRAARERPPRDRLHQRRRPARVSAPASRNRPRSTRTATPRSRSSACSPAI